MVREMMLTTHQGLQRHTPPMRLYEKAKRLGVWNPTTLDLSQDRADWLKLNALEQDVLLRLTSMFQAGEEAVTLDLLPLMMAIAQEGRIEEEMYLTTFLFEEAKHTDFFNRFIAEVAIISEDLSRYHTENYRTIFYDALPTTLQALQMDSSPAAQVRASVTYNMIVEGVLAETGYHAYFKALTRGQIMPGIRAGVNLLKQDESRHIAYGIFLMSRLLAEDDTLWPIIEETMNELLPAALGVVGDTFACYEEMPFGLVEADFVDFALNQFQKRFERIEKARGATLDDVYRVTQKAIDENDS